MLPIFKLPGAMWVHNSRVFFARVASRNTFQVSRVQLSMKALETQVQTPTINASLLTKSINRWIEGKVAPFTWDDGKDFIFETFHFWKRERWVRQKYFSSPNKRLQMNDELREKKKGRKREVQLLIAWANPIHNRDIKLTYQFFFHKISKISFFN